MVASCYIGLGPKTLCNQGRLSQQALQALFSPSTLSFILSGLLSVSKVFLAPSNTRVFAHFASNLELSLPHSCHPAQDQAQCPFCRRPLPDTTDAFIISTVFIKSIINAKLYDQLLYACFSC